VLEDSTFTISYADSRSQELSLNDWLTAQGRHDIKLGDLTVTALVAPSEQCLCQLVVRLVPQYRVVNLFQVDVLVQLVEKGQALSVKLAPGQEYLDYTVSRKSKADVRVLVPGHAWSTPIPMHHKLQDRDFGVQPEEMDTHSIFKIVVKKADCLKAWLYSPAYIHNLTELDLHY
jgi:hypothetical protein